MHFCCALGPRAGKDDLRKSGFDEITHPTLTRAVAGNTIPIRSRVAANVARAFGACLNRLCRLPGGPGFCRRLTLCRPLFHHYTPLLHSKQTGGGLGELRATLVARERHNPPLSPSPFIPRRLGLSPLLSQRPQIRPREIFGRHGNPKLHFGIECEKPRLGQHWDLGRILDVDDQGATTPAVLLGEIDSFGLDGLENSLDLLPCGAIPNGGVERFERELNVHKHAHD